jgi:hypothetical protein
MSLQKSGIKDNANQSAVDILSYFCPLRLEEMTADKAQFDTTLKNLERDLEEKSEELSKVSIECDVWRSKFLASRFV